MKQLSGLDATFLYLETPEMPMHVGALNIYELPAGQRGRFITRLRKHMAERMPLMPVLRRRLWWMPLNLANPAWVDADPDLRYHIVEHRLAKSPGGSMGNSRGGADDMAELEALVGHLHGQRLERDRPLWKLHVIEGLGPSASGLKRIGLYSQFHHAAVDGQAAVALAQVILDISPKGRDLSIRPSTRQRSTRLSLSQMLRGALANEVQQVTSIVRNLPSTVGTLTGAASQALKRSGLLSRAKTDDAQVSNLSLAPRTVFNRSISAGRVFAGVSLPLAELKAIGKAHGATLNDIVLLICSTALRRYLQQHKSLPRKSLVAAVPISLRAKGDTASDNQASMSLVSLGTQVADLRDRLAHVKAATAAMKSTLGDVRSILPTDFPSIGVPWLMEAVTALYGKAKVAERIPQVANVVISNVPGPPVALYLAGARMQCNFPTSIVVHGLALNITVESYDQQMDFGLVADALAMPDVRALAKAIEIAFEDLRLLMEPQISAAESLPEALGASVLAAARRGVQAGVDSVSGARRAAQDVVSAAVSNVLSTAVQTAVKEAVGVVTRGTARARAGAPIKQARRR